MTTRIALNGFGRIGRQLIKAITGSTVESKNRATFQTRRRWIQNGLVLLALVIVLVPISYMIRSTVIFR